MGKEYRCNWCYTVNVIKDEDICRKQIAGRMASGLVGYCTKCKKEHRMFPVESK